MIDLIGFNEISEAMPFLGIYEQSIDEAVSNSQEGIFIGSSRNCNMPVFIDTRNLLNPHMLICGMTGSGKTYLAKNIYLRLSLFSGASTLIIDFTGEYSDYASTINNPAKNLAKQLFGNSPASAYMDLHLLPESEKIRKTSEILDEIVSISRKSGTSKRNRLFILLDEAWKLVEHCKSLETLIREGRKYGIGLITASQMLHDTSQVIISNVATIFVFKTANAKSLDTLSKTLNISADELSGIQNLGLGSCFLILHGKNGIKSKFFIRRVFGNELTHMITLCCGGKMEISIPKRTLENELNALCGAEKAKSMQDKINSGRISLPMLISFLIDSGADRRQVLSVLEKIGFKRDDLADSFALALNIINSRK